MTIPAVQQAVLDRAQAEAQRVLDEGRRQADARFEREAARRREEHARRVESMKAELEAGLDREVGARRTEDRNKLLAMKNDIIADVFAKAIDGIRSLPDDGYATWLKGQLERVPKTEGAQVVVNAADRDTAASLLGQLPGDAGLALSDKSAPIEAGLLVEGAQADLDFSVESLLDVLRESLSEEIASRLFADAGEAAEQPTS